MFNSSFHFYLLFMAFRVLTLMYSDGWLYRAFRVFRVLRLIYSDRGLYREYRMLRRMYM